MVDRKSFEIQIAATDQAGHAFGKLGLVVNKDSNDKFSRELWLLRRYVATLIRSDQLLVPATLTGGGTQESPDFIIVNSRGYFGIEVTEATTEEDQVFHRSAPPGTYFAPSPGQERFVRSDVWIEGRKRPVQEPAGILTQPGWTGDELEKEWRKRVLEAASKKAALIKRIIGNVCRDTTFSFTRMG